MRDYSDQQLARIGVAALVVAVVAFALAMNIQRLPGMRGVGYSAELRDASGLKEGDMVQMAGIDIGRISDIDLVGRRVTVHFTVDAGTDLGSESTASVKVLNLLGVKYLNLTSVGEQPLEEDGTIPLSRTEAGYDVIRVLSELSSTTENMDIPQLRSALDVVAETMDRANPEARRAFTGLSRISRAIVARDDELQTLLARAHRVTDVLADRKEDILSILEDGGLLLQELDRRREAIHSLLVNTKVMAREIGGLVADNEEQLGPMLDELETVTDFLIGQERQLRLSVRRLGPFVTILGNIVGTGPWFDAILPNFLGFGTGEFVPEADG